MSENVRMTDFHALIESYYRSYRPSMSMAEYVRFEGDQIAAIEVFVGRPIEA